MTKVLTFHVFLDPEERARIPSVAAVGDKEPVQRHYWTRALPEKQHRDFVVSSRADDMLASFHVQVGIRIKEN